MNRFIPSTNEIEAYLHCGLCIKEMEGIEISPRDFQSVEVGWTKQGFQVWCKRHDCNIIHVDFEGQKFHANNNRQQEDHELT